MLCVAMLLPSTAVFAQAGAKRTVPGQAVATIAALEGEVTLERKAKVTPLAVDAELFEGDRIRTSADGRAEIALKDGSRLTLTALGNLTVSRYLVSPKQNKREAGFELLSGRLRAFVSKFAASIDESVWQVRTPTAVAGVRGTEFFVLVDDGEGGGEPGTDIVVEEGEVEVGSIDPAIEGLIRLLPGQLSRVTQGQAPGAPQAAAGVVARVRRLMATAREREAASRREGIGASDPLGSGSEDGGEGGGPGAPQGNSDPFGDLGGDLPPFQQVPSTLPGGGGPEGPLPPVDPLPAVLDIDVRVNDQVAP
jgi:hypothetical protein